MRRERIQLLLTTLCMLLIMGTSVSAQRISGIINSYAKVTSFDACNKRITVLNANGFSSGTKALLIQMQGATADDSQSPSFGTITDYKSVGNFEFVKIKSIRSNEIELEFTPLFDYDVQGNVQLVTVPSYRNTVFLNGVLTAKPWDGATGGILVFETTAALDLDIGSIDVSGLGFRGGTTVNGSKILANIPTYYTPATEPDSGAAKGEGIVRPFLGKEFGRGALANGGGGGNGHNAGGAGGGNGGAGGNGGREYHGPPPPTDNGGIWGRVIDPNRSTLTPRLCMGGGGGAGQMNNNVGTSGGNGGGIIIIRAKNIVGRNKVIKCNGASQGTLARNDGGGGGGAGGSVFLDIDEIISVQGFTIEAMGGAGGNVNVGADHGAGGGGGGGFVFINNQSFQDKITLQLNGGKNGINIANNSTTMAMPGANGSPVFGYRIQESTAPELSIGPLNNEIICKGSSRQIGGTAKGGRPPYTYEWSPTTYLDDPTSARPTTKPDMAMRYTVTVTDANGCTTNSVVSVNLFSLPEIELDDTLAVCIGDTRRIQAKGTGKFLWSPTNELQFPDSANPIITPTISGFYYVTLTDVNTCSQIDSIYIKVNPLPSFTLPDTVFVCQGNDIMLEPQNETGKGAFSYQWTSSEFIATPTQRTLQFTPKTSARYILTMQDENLCMVKDSVELVVYTAAIADAGDNKTLCVGSSVQLQGKGGSRYFWSPNEDISDITSPTPTVSPRVSRDYYLRIENSNGCVAYDTVQITVLPLPDIPIIENATDTLFIAQPIGKNSSFIWKYNGEIIARDSIRIIAQSSGDYTVEITDENGCSRESLPFTYSIGSAQFCITPLRAAVGETVTIPIYLCNTKSLVESKATTVEATVSFNKSTLMPIGEYAENTIDGTRRLLRIQAAIPQDTTQPLAVIKATALLGTDTLTRIFVSNGKSIGGKVVLTSGIGIYITEGVCLEGGLRLWQDGNRTGIQSIIHHDRTSTIAYTLASTEPHSIIVSTSLGMTAAQFTPSITEAGAQLFTFDNSFLASGVYFMTVITPTEKSVLPFQILK